MGYHDMKMISMLLAFCEGNSLVSVGFSAQTAEIWGFFYIFFEVILNKLLNKQSFCS